MDIGGLAGMTKLTSLNVNVGDVKDFSPLAGLTSLIDLNMYGEYVLEDLSFLRNLTQLQNLHMS